MSSKILIVEDDSLNILIYKYIFKSEPFELDFAFDGEQGIGKIKKESYSLFLLDLNLPLIDGYGVAKFIRTQEMQQNIGRRPVFMISASFNSYSDFTSLSPDVDKFIAKPFDIVHLKSSVNLYLLNYEEQLKLRNY